MWPAVMDLLHGLRTKPSDKLHENTPLVIIKLPHYWVIKLMGRAAILALAIASLLCSGLVLGKLTSNFQQLTSNFNASFEANVEFLPVLFRDFVNEGLLKMGDRVLFINDNNNNNNVQEAIYESPTLNNNIDLIANSDLEKHRSIPNNSYDIVFVSNFQALAEFVDKVLKVNGIVVVQLSDNPAAAFKKPANYNIVYLRRFDWNTVAMRKMSQADDSSPTKRRLFELGPEAKRAALKKLEDVLLEPPRAASGKSNRYLKRTKYLPDLLGDSLESYPRRVFIDVGPPQNTPATVGSWFEKHYPTRNKDFEIIKIETEESSSGGREIGGMSEWLRKNVREEEYVVMKAEAEVVEEMLSNKAIGLVDELFLECGIKGKQKGRKSRRAYWECLALYGMLRDEGVAVHQWWG
ncbi:hypothetical protein LguiA_004090 [Lonicera macranthoides]